VSKEKTREEIRALRYKESGLSKGVPFDSSLFLVVGPA
jgi:hypothetical protein